MCIHDFAHNGNLRNFYQKLCFSPDLLVSSLNNRWIHLVAKEIPNKSTIFKYSIVHHFDHCMIFQRKLIKYLYMKIHIIISDYIWQSCFLHRNQQAKSQQLVC